MSRPIKLLVGFLTSVPLIYFSLFFCFIVGSVIWAQFGGQANQGIPGLPVVMLLLVAAHLGTMFLMAAMTVFYVVYLVKSDRVPQDQKVLWAAIIVIFNVMAMPVFYVLYVWPEAWPPKWVQKHRSAPSALRS